MRTIPVPNRQPVADTQPSAAPQRAQVSNLRLDAGALGAPAAAMVRAGDTVQGGAEMLGRFALAKQDQVNKGILASEETIRMQTAAGIQEHFAANPDSPELWGDHANAAWKSYEEGRSERQKLGKWGQDVATKDDLQYKTFRGEVGIRFRAEQDKALVRQSNARLEANAETKLRAGDYDGFVKSIDQMNLFPDQKERAVRRGLEEGLNKIAGNQLDALRDLPPSKAIPAIEAFIANLNDKTKDGKFKDYEFERGGLSLGARQQIESVARARIREQERAMDVNGRHVIAQIRMGRATEADVFNLVKTGEMTPGVAKAIMPDVAIAVDEWQAKVDAKELTAANKKEAERRRKEETAQQQDRKTESLRTAALDRGKVGLRDIDRQLALGEITAGQASQLKEELIQASRAEIQMEKGDYAMISEKIRGGMTAKMFGRQPSDKEFQRIHADILGAKHLTKETRLKLVDELFQLKLADISDLQEEGPADGRWLDRDITAPERDLRRGLLGDYRKLLPALGDVTAGDLMFSQEARIRGFFDTAKQGGRTAAEIEKFKKEQLLPEIQKAAGFEALKDAFKF